MNKIFLAFTVTFLLFFSGVVQALNLSDEAEISLLTCGPSKQVHALYGHSAIRVHDPIRMVDIVFNYGVFSFSEPNFVYRFAKGQTDYLLAAEKYENFLESYRRSQRRIEEQVLNLTQAKKQQLLDYLIWNAKPENREYRYNFFMDNCATRVRDVVEKHVDGELVFPEEAGLEMSFREHVDEYQRILPWINFGIHLTLGSPADENATAYQEMFLPDFLRNHFARAQIQGEGVSKPLVKETRMIYDPAKSVKSDFNLLSPVYVLSILLALVILVSYKQYKRKQFRLWVDYVLLFITGLIGLVLLWFVAYSEHPAMHPNYNLWWAVPANFLFPFLWMVRRWRPALKWYWKALSVWLLLFLLFSLLIPQAFPVGFYLLTGMVLCRALLHSFLLLNASHSAN
ncbi:lipoprotein N-acyltransferase Lnb domain-containing protein [Sunxiuqinia sp. sy24]|uniref:lipoprotein N-acyltransferase Lnb domain-containing protein n=1 Tax=Sunxiuqinia sp. sy24 TaxID=3461495 RepID=UPI004045758A